MALFELKANLLFRILKATPSVWEDAPLSRSAVADWPKINLSAMEPTGAADSTLFARLAIFRLPSPKSNYRQLL
jgi:hypothetical protein